STARLTISRQCRFEMASGSMRLKLRHEFWKRYEMKKIDERNISRRTMLRAAGLAGVSALIAGLPSGWRGAAWASDAPEVTDLNFGMIALTDCSPIVIAHEKGLFKKYGINSKITKGASWAAIRDSLSNGDLQATHMLIGMPIASTMG